MVVNWNESAWLVGCVVLDFSVLHPAVREGKFFTLQHCGRLEAVNELVDEHLVGQLDLVGVVDRRGSALLHILFLREDLFKFDTFFLSFG